jgi:hypothetical protein
MCRVCHRRWSGISAQKKAAKKVFCIIFILSSLLYHRNLYAGMSSTIFFIYMPYNMNKLKKKYVNWPFIYSSRLLVYSIICICVCFSYGSAKKNCRNQIEGGERQVRIFSCGCKKLARKLVPNMFIVYFKRLILFVNIAN